MDDFAITVTLNSTKSNCKKLEGIALELISRAKEATISFDTSKTELIHFYRKRTTIEEGLKLGVTDYRHCVKTRDRYPEGSKTASTPPYILIADQYYLQITAPISAIYYPIISYYPHLLYIYIEALDLYLQ